MIGEALFLGGRTDKFVATSRKEHFDQLDPIWPLGVSRWSVQRMVPKPECSARHQ